VAELRERLESLKGQFHLPPNPVPLEDQARTKSATIKRRKDNDVFGILQRLGLEFLPVPGGVAAELFFRAVARLFSFPNRTQTTRNHARSAVDVDRPLTDLPRLSSHGQPPQQRHPPSLRGKQGQRRRIEAD